MSQFENEANPLYMACEPYIRRRVLDLVLPEDMSAFDYVPSARGDPRYLLLETYSRYAPNHVQWQGQDIGPVEEALLHFVFDDRDLNLLVLVGGLGCGKTTTLRYLTDRYIQPSGAQEPPSHVCYVDFTASLPAELIGAPADRTAGLSAQADLPADSSIYDEHLLNAIGKALNPLLSFDDEIKHLWTWALLPDPTGAQHSSKLILYEASQHLRDAGAGAFGAGDGAVFLEERRKLLRAYRKEWDVAHRLKYVCLQVDYLITTVFGGDPSRVLLILDNLDPLPPMFHRRVMNFAKRFARAAHCKVILSLRPLTYANAGQVADCIIDYVEHRGPALDVLLRTRICRYLLEPDDEQLAKYFRQVFEQRGSPHELRQVLVRGSRYVIQYRDFMIPFSWIRCWFEAVCAILCSAGLQRGTREAGAPDAHLVINGASGFSLRAGKLLAEKVCSSHALPIFRSLGLSKAPWTRRDRKHFPNISALRKGEAIPEANLPEAEPLRDSDVISAMLLKRHDEFRPSLSRIFTNLFTCGRREPRDLTCKIRMLHWLKFAEQREVPTTVGELYQWMGAFDYDDEAITEGLNRLISDYKRLAWTDSVARFATTLPSYAAVTISLAPIGDFYLSYLVYNSDYLQAMSASSAVGTLGEQGTGDLAGRLRGLRLFLDQLLERDCREVRAAIANYQRKQYLLVYGPRMFSREIFANVKKGCQAYHFGQVFRTYIWGVAGQG